MRNNNQSQLVPRQPGYGSLAVRLQVTGLNQHICR